MPIEAQEPDITLASTTESQAELDHATGPEWRKHFTPAAPKEETKPAGSTEKKTAEETKTAPVSETGKPGAKEGKSESETDEPLPKGVQKRIDTLTARLARAEERLRERETALPKPAEAKAAVTADPEPQQKDFDSWEKWNAAHNRWLVRDEQHKLDAKNAQDAEQSRSREAYDGHLSRIEEARTTHADFDDAVKAMPAFEFASPQSNIAFQLAVVEAENGPEIMYHLAQHPEEMAKFADLSPVKVQLLLGRLSAALSPSESTAPKPAVSRTPAPTTPVRRQTTATGTNHLDPEVAKKMTDDEWLRARENELRGRNSRRH